MLENGSPINPKANRDKEDHEIEDAMASKFPTTASPYHKKIDPEDGLGAVAKKAQMPPASVMTRLILIMVWRKLIRNPNTYASLLGLIWSLISFR